MVDFAGEHCSALLFKIKIAHDAVGRAVEGLFVDGGVSPHNSPALQMFLMASLPSYHLNWSKSPENLQIISVGAGTHRNQSKQRGNWAFRLLASALDWCVAEWIAERRTKYPIDECAWCGQRAGRSPTVTALAGSVRARANLHLHCALAWQARQRSDAEVALARLGLRKPF